MKAYSIAQKTAGENGAARSLPFGQRAIELDPSFAMAYEAVGIHYFNLAEPARAAEYLTKAFQLRNHASERERLRITAAYYSSVTGELDKAGRTYPEQISEYPRDIAAYNNMGIVLAQEGLYEQAAGITKQGIQIDPSQVRLDENLTGYLLASDHFDEARQISMRNNRINQTTTSSRPLSTLWLSCPPIRRRWQSSSSGSPRRRSTKPSGWRWSPIRRPFPDICARRGN